MPYRFTFNIPAGTGSGGSGPVLDALNSHVQMMIYSQLQPMAVMLQELMPILSDEEWNALPQHQKNYFTYDSMTLPRPMPQHYEAPPVIRVARERDAADAQRVFSSIGTVEQTERLAAQVLNRAFEARPDAPAIRARRNVADTSRPTLNIGEALLQFRDERRPPREAGTNPNVTRARPGETFTDTEPEDI